jgi:uncharacterized membrane protein YdbT with pleckstrin-like domain
MRTELRPKERLEFQCRRHWIILVKPVLIFVLCVIITGGSFLVFARQQDPEIRKVWLWAQLVNLIPLAHLIWKVLERRYDIWAVTSQRVVDEWGVLSHNAKESPLDKINNISYEQPLMGRIWNYGDVQIQTAAEMGATTYQLVANPRGLKDAVTRGQEDYKESQITDQAEALANAMQRKSAPAEGDTTECPFCAERIKAHAKICRFCGRDLPEQAAK